MEILNSIFGSQTKVKLLRLFLFNENVPFLMKEITSRTKCSHDSVRRELSILMRSGLVKKRTISKEMSMNPHGKIVTKKIKGVGYLLDQNFPYLDSLKNFLTVATLHADDSLVKRFSGIGKLKLFVASGVFIQNWDARVDLLIVGDEMSQGRIESIIKTIESEIGKEISYSAFETQDFEYRYSIHDRLVRDIFDYPHVTLLDRLGIEPQ